jgi:hypothetical protein
MGGLRVRLALGLGLGLGGFAGFSSLGASLGLRLQGGLLCGLAVGVCGGAIRRRAAGGRRGLGLMGRRLLVTRLSVMGLGHGLAARGGLRGLLRPSFGGRLGGVRSFSRLLGHRIGVGLHRLSVSRLERRPRRRWSGLSRGHLLTLNGRWRARGWPSAVTCSSLGRPVLLAGVRG